MANDITGLRYAAHHRLAAIGPMGQQKIHAATVLLIGLGGLGCPVAQYLAASGVGELHLCDFDRVSESNLARQILYRASDVGHGKCETAAKRLAGLGPDTHIVCHDQRADQANLAPLVTACDLVIDASDNYGTRLAVNRVCMDTATPWIMGSCIRMEGQVMSFDPADAEAPCYRCVYGQAPETLEDCPGAGIFATVAGMTGTQMAHIALSRLAGLTLATGLQLLDASAMDWQRIAVKRLPGCPDCGHR
jgi:adenylyltransferase/sulfurtransferase